MKRKDFAIIWGILVHPVKMLLFKLGKDREHYNIILGGRAAIRANEKALNRRLYIASITKTNVNL